MLPIKINVLGNLSRGKADAAKGVSGSQGRFSVCVFLIGPSLLSPFFLIKFSLIGMFKISFFKK